MSYHVMSYHIMAYNIISHHTIPYHIISTVIFWQQRRRALALQFGHVEGNVAPPHETPVDVGDTVLYHTAVLRHDKHPALHGTRVQTAGAARRCGVGHGKWTVSSHTGRSGPR